MRKLKKIVFVVLLFIFMVPKCMGGTHIIEISAQKAAKHLRLRSLGREHSNLRPIVEKSKGNAPLLFGFLSDDGPYGMKAWVEKFSHITPERPPEEEIFLSLQTVMLQREVHLHLEKMSRQLEELLVINKAPREVKFSENHSPEEVFFNDRAPESYRIFPVYFARNEESSHPNLSVHRPLKLNNDTEEEYGF